MDEIRYAITENILMDIVDYAINHPDKHFCIDAYTDSTGEFLSCFFLKDDEDGYPIWELDEVAKTKQEVIDEMQKRICRSRKV